MCFDQQVPVVQLSMPLVTVIKTKIKVHILQLCACIVKDISLFSFLPVCFRLYNSDLTPFLKFFSLLSLKSLFVPFLIKRE